jgi:diguanylate cyclase (GGDEF)-like protein/PAS domain S-box-containing protein
MDMADSSLIIMLDNRSAVRTDVSLALQAAGYSVLECGSETGVTDLLLQVQGLIGQPARCSNLGVADSEGQTWQSLGVFQRVIEASRSGIWICDAHEAHLPVIHVNPAFERITGLTAAQVLGLPGAELCRQLFASQDFDLPLLAQQPAFPNQPLRCLQGNTGTSWVELAVDMVPDPQGAPAHYVAALTDVSVRIEHEAQLARLATTDTLTGLANRTLLQDRLMQAVGQAERSRMPFALLHVDLDRFSQINDRLGCVAADGLLQQVAQRLLALVREGDTVARVGPDQFMLIMLQLVKPEDAAFVARKIHAGLGGMSLECDHSLALQFSIGVVLYPADGTRPEQLLRHASIALAQVKQAGGNGFRLFSPEMQLTAGNLLEVDARMRQALVAGEFVLHYQPKADLFSGELSGFEALIRWQHPEHGLLAPDRFIRQAEETGAIVAIGYWVLQQACRQALQWQQQGLSPCRVAVNLSARQFQQPDLVEAIRQILQETGLKPCWLELELTESMLMQDIPAAVRTLVQLKQLGVMLSMDDFGTGYSSLGYLKQFPFDVLKIDRSFVQNITTEPDDALIAVAVISMAHSLGMHVVAEGVENECQMRYLRNQHCDEMQGYFFSRPLLPDDATGFIRSQIRLPVLAGSHEPGQRTLLLVDDEADILKALQRLLRRRGYRILTAQSAERALELMALNDVQVVVSDQRMPGIGGSELLSRIRELYPNTVRIMLSGYSEIGALTEAINQGAIYRYLTKPWDDEQLREEIRSAFVKYEQESELSNRPPPVFRGNTDE